MNEKVKLITSPGAVKRDVVTIPRGAIKAIGVIDGEKQVHSIDVSIEYVIEQLLKMGYARAVYTTFEATSSPDLKIEILVSPGE